MGCFEYTDYITLPIGSLRTISVDYIAALSSTDVIATVSVTENSGGTGLTITNSQVNSVAYTDEFGDTVKVGGAVQFQVSCSASESKVYELKVVANTTDSGETFVDYIQLSFEYRD